MVMQTDSVYNKGAKCGYQGMFQGNRNKIQLYVNSENFKCNEKNGHRECDTQKALMQEESRQAASYITSFVNGL